VKVYKTQTKEEIEKKIFIPKYKLTQYPNGNAELAETFRYLSDYLKAQEFYGFDPIAFENLLEGFDNLLRAELAIGGESSKAWYQEKKEDLLKDVIFLAMGIFLRTPSVSLRRLSVIIKVPLMEKEFKKVSCSVSLLI
jgi:hypothetical protein